MNLHRLDGPAKIDLDAIPTGHPKKLTKDDAKERFAELNAELFELQDLMWGAKTNSVLVVLQGRDAAGKDGAVKHVIGALNPRGALVTSFGVPTEEERQHDFLWRVHRHAPRAGELAIWNRSHYEDVLVVRVHEWVSRSVWKSRYQHINDFEALLAESGTIVLKLFLHISKDEQEERLLEREKEAASAWKLNVQDWKEREEWDEFSAAYEDVLSLCATPQAPWIVVPADSKWYRNLVVAEALAQAMRPFRKKWMKKLEAEGKEGRAELQAFRKQRADERKGRARADRKKGESAAPESKDGAGEK